MNGKRKRKASIRGWVVVGCCAVSDFGGVVMLGPDACSWLVPGLIFWADPVVQPRKMKCYRRTPVPTLETFHAGSCTWTLNGRGEHSGPTGQLSAPQRRNLLISPRYLISGTRAYFSRANAANSTKRCDRLGERGSQPSRAHDANGSVV